MIKIFILLAIVIVLVIIFKILSEKFEYIANPTQEYFPYIKRKYPLTLKERELFAILQEMYGTEFHVFPQIHIASLLSVRNGERRWQTYFNKIIRKSVDFVLFDKQNMGPMVAIELDDKTHEQNSRMERDSFVDGAFKAAGIPLVHIKTHELENRIEVKQKIDLALPKYEPAR